MKVIAALSSCLAWLLLTAAAPLVREAGAPAATGTSPGCDGSLAQAFRPDPLTTVVLVRYFAKGAPLALAEPVTERTARAADDLCLVKLNVGPGHPGPADAPSTSPGIGIEVWLPAPSRWNGRVHAIGGGGWVGGVAGSPTALVSDPRPATVAGVEGAVSSSSDAGHSGMIAGTPSSGGDFAMLPDGSVNRTLWRDFSSRAIHEQAVKTKALATLYYGSAPRHSYWDGSSTGGRQALKLAQAHPEDFDGILANLPAIHWTSLATAGLYPQILFQRDLGGVPLAEAQLDLVSKAAIHACDVVGGRHLGYILDNAACHYDPVGDPEVLCTADGGRNPTPACVTRRQAAVIDKIWYGMTADGSAPAPASDNGAGDRLAGKRRWYGLLRGTSLYNQHYSHLFGVNAGWANSGGPWTITSDQVALNLERSALADPSFRNAGGNGRDGWKALSYAQLAEAFDRGLARQDAFDHVNSDDPDLSAFRARGGKMLGWHGLNDEVIPALGTVNYYRRVMARMGGLAATQRFYRLYLVPGNGHGPYNGTADPTASPPSPGGGQFYDLLVAWVERGDAPNRVVIETPPSAPVRRSQPICPFPQKAVHIGGDPDLAASFACR